MVALCIQIYGGGCDFTHRNAYIHVLTTISGFNIINIVRLIGDVSASNNSTNHISYYYHLTKYGVDVYNSAAFSFSFSLNFITR